MVSLPHAHVKGRRKARKAKQQRVDIEMKSPTGEIQIMYRDVVVYFDKALYMMCLSKPLGLLTVSLLANVKTATLAGPVQTHISTIRSKGFLPSIIHLDPMRDFLSMEVNVPGVELDITGAGDHMQQLDVHVQHCKVVFRSVRSALQWK